MSIFTSIFRSRDKPQDRTAGSGYSFFMGSSTSGKQVTERSAMQMTAVYACVRILAEAIAGLPVHLWYNAFVNPYMQEFTFLHAVTRAEKDGMKY